MIPLWTKKFKAMKRQNKRQRLRSKQTQRSKILRMVVDYDGVAGNAQKCSLTQKGAKNATQPYLSTMAMILARFSFMMEVKSNSKPLNHKRLLLNSRIP